VTPLEIGFATGTGDTDNTKLLFDPRNNQIYIMKLPERCQGIHSYSFLFSVKDSDGSIDQHSHVIKLGST
jgi:hypothetical protein